MRLIDADALMEAFREYMAKKHDREKCISEENCNACDRGCLWRKIVVNAHTIGPASLRPTGEWISVEERMPESGIHVLLCCEIRSGGTVYKRYVCDGYYAKRYTEQTWNNSGDIDCEYHEEDDEYYLLEGWYEVIKNWDDYNSIAIGDFVTYWMPLPEPPNCGAKMQGAT